MAQLSDLSDTVSNAEAIAPIRRHTDSPRLWWGVIFGSMGVHMLLLAATFPLIVQVSTSQSSSPPIPVELVELSPADSFSEELLSPASATEPSSPSPDSLAPAEASSEFSTPEFSQSDTAKRPDPDIQQPDLLNLPEASPVPTPANRRGRSPAPSNPPPPPIPSPAPSPPLESSDPVPSPIPEGSEPPDAETIPPEDSGDVATAPPLPAPPLPDTPAPQPSSDSGDGLNLPPVPVSSNPVPASLSASIVNISTVPPDQQTDLPEQDAVLEGERTQTFISDPTQSACVVTPQILPYLGQTVTLQLLINEEGEVDDAWLWDQNTPTDPYTPYTDLAACLIKNWRFRPAMTQGRSHSSDNLIVSIVVTQ